MAGATRIIGAAQMVAPVTLYARDNGAQSFQSISISNSTSATTCFVYLGTAVAGNPFMTVAPLGAQTLPCAPSANVTISFDAAMGQSFDGSVTVSASSEPLSASGFTAQPYTVAPPAPIPFGSELYGGSGNSGIQSQVSFTTGAANEAHIIYLLDGSLFTASFFYKLYLTTLVLTGNDIDRVLLGLNVQYPSVVQFNLPAFRGNVHLENVKIPLCWSGGTRGQGITLTTLEAFTAPLNLQIVACAGYLESQ